MTLILNPTRFAYLAIKLKFFFTSHFVSDHDHFSFAFQISVLSYFSIYAAHLLWSMGGLKSSVFT